MTRTADRRGFWLGSVWGADCPYVADLSGSPLRPADQEGGRICSGCFGWEQSGDEGLPDETTVLFGWPSALADEQVVEFGRAVGPQDVGGFPDGDAGPQVTGVEQAADVEGHPLVPGGADLPEDGGHLGIAGGGVTRQGDDGGGPGGDLGGEGAPGGEDPAGVGLGVADTVGSLLGGFRAFSSQAFLDDGPHQP